MTAAEAACGSVTSPMLKAFAGGTLFGAAHGTLPPAVVAFPGWRHDHADFAAVLAGLDAAAVDPPGFGATPAPPAAWGGAEYAAAVAAVLDEVAAPVVLVGHSFGGRIAAHLAAARPDRVRAVVLTGVPLLRRTDSAAAKAPLAFRTARWLHRRGLLSDDAMEARRRRHGSADYRAATGVMRDVLVRSVNETYEEPLRALRCRVELVWGEADDQVPVEVAERALALLADGHLTVVPGVGHLLPTDAPDALRAAVDRCLA